VSEQVARRQSPVASEERAVPPVVGLIRERDAAWKCYCDARRELERHVHGLPIGTVITLTYRETWKNDHERVVIRRVNQPSTGRAVFKRETPSGKLGHPMAFNRLLELLDTALSNHGTVEVTT
jgi:hypothetical protein